MTSSGFTSLFQPRWSSGLVLAASLLSVAAGFWFPSGVSSLPRQTTESAFPRGATAGDASEKPKDLETSASEAWQERWRQQSARANSPARTRDLAALLEALARTDPQRALALALAEPNWLTRDQLRSAALRGWGATAPDAAADWAMAQSVLGERMACVEAVLTGAAEKPDDAIRVALRLCAADPVAGGDYGHTVINALVAKTGDFDAARRFALAATMVDRQSFLLDSTFYQWAQHEPQQALAELKKITDPTVRSAALKGVVAGFADSDPQKLAEYAQALPPGEDRSQALGVALPQWMGKDPEAALQWIDRVDPNPDFDKGVAALALLPSMIETRPELAMEITDNICDSAQRALTKSNVFIRWAQNDPASARRYAEGLQNQEYREMLLQDLASVLARRKDQG